MAGVLLLLATAAFAAPHNAAVILLPPAGTYTPQLSGLSDTITNTVAALDGWNVLLLHPTSPLLNGDEAEQFFAAATEKGQNDALPKLAMALDLDDVFLIRIAITEDNTNAEKPRLSTLWATAGSASVRTFDVEMDGLSPKDARKAADSFADAITRGFETALLCDTAENPVAQDNPPATTPATTVSQPDTTQIPVQTEPDQPTATPPDAVPAVATQPDTSEPVQTTPQDTGAPSQDTAPADTPPVVTPVTPSQPGPEPVHAAAARKAIANGDLELAKRELDLGYRTGESSLELYLVQADLARVQGDAMGQRKALESAARLEPDKVEPLLQLAALFRSQGLWQKAAKTYDQAIAVDSACTAAYTSAAAVYSAQDMPRKAAEYLEKAIQHELGNASLLVKLGDAYHAAEDIPKAEEAYELAARSADQRTRCQIFDKLGDMYVDEGRFEEGFNSYVEATRLRDESDRKYARERYDHIMITADEAVVANLNICTDLFDAYSASRNVPREKVYIAAEHATAQIQKVIDFASSITAPDDLTERHLRRQVAYNIAFEAAVNLMTYIDTNLEDPLSIYRRAVSEAAAEFDALRHARGQ